jgi:4-carboxymuconolactone decarboxylase
MRLTEPRIDPLTEEALTQEQAEVIAPTLERKAVVANVILTLMRNMPLFTSINVLGRHIMSESSLTPRLREILIMRVGWTTRCEYQWGQHVRMSASAGLTAGDHTRIKQGAGAAGWTELESALIAAVDQLLGDTMIDDETWAVLARHLSIEQLTDTVFTVGHYNMVAMALNSIGVQSEPGLPGFDG